MDETNRPTRVLIHGLAHFAQKFPFILQRDGWDIRSYDIRRLSHLVAMTHYLQRCDLAFSWTGRITIGKFLSVTRLLRKKKVVLFWCGSDVLFAQQEYEARRFVEPWIAEKIHWAGAPWLAEEVRAMGLNCEYMPITWVQPVRVLSPFPRKFSVLAYTPNTHRAELYGVDQVLEVARAMPTIPFTIVGLLPGQKLDAPDNVQLHGWVEDMTPFYRNATVVWRPTRHDGMAFMALEALAHGRHVIWSYPSPGVIQSRDASTARIELERLLELHQTHRLELNRPGAEFVAANFTPTRIRDGMLERWRQIVQSPLPPMETSYATRPYREGVEQRIPPCARSAAAGREPR